MTIDLKRIEDLDITIMSVNNTIKTNYSIKEGTKKLGTTKEYDFIKFDIIEEGDHEEKHDIIIKKYTDGTYDYKSSIVESGEFKLLLNFKDNEYFFTEDCDEDDDQVIISLELIS